MTAALAAFALSDEGQYYDLVCRRYGMDPGAVFEDDWLAFELRAGLVAATSKPSQPATPLTDASVDQAWAEAGKQLEREWLGA